jgi:hypothetical protein
MAVNSIPDQKPSATPAGPEGDAIVLLEPLFEPLSKP